MSSAKAQLFLKMLILRYNQVVKIRLVAFCDKYKLAEFLLPGII